MNTEPDNEWDIAFSWLCHSRKHHPAGADVWDLIFHWHRERHELWHQVQSCSWRLSPMLICRAGYDEDIAVWRARDALILKWTALHLKHVLPQHLCCGHTAGNGGVTGNLRCVSSAIRSGEYHFVWRTDIRGYYRHINKKQMLSQIINRIASSVLRSLAEQFLFYSIEYGGEIKTPLNGIPRGCALSPLLGSSHLYHVDCDMSTDRTGLFYVRYMDDFLFLSKKRWPLRRAIRDLHQWFAIGGFETHPNKTQLGKTAKGFDWLGIDFDDTGATGISRRATENHLMKRRRLEEQCRRRGYTPEDTRLRLSAYEIRWQQWAMMMNLAAND
ncbi:transposase [Salmonella enterica]|nr:transposase [Salmonella enterica]